MRWAVFSIKEQNQLLKKLNVYVRDPHFCSNLINDDDDEEDEMRLHILFFSHSLTQSIQLTQDPKAD